MSFNLLIAPDSFKHALSAVEVAKAIARGAERLPNKDIHPILFPLSDGGEGMSAILTHHSGGTMMLTTVSDPLFRSIIAHYGLSANKQTAFIEMAEASGLQLLLPNERNPMHTTTYGTGQMILHAIQQGAKHIILGIGGSATNDGGIGMAAALGYRFLDEHGHEISPVGKTLTQIATIDRSQLLFNPDELRITLACDVNNPLCGKTGAANTYARQKGASENEVALLEKGLQHYSEIVHQQLGINIAHVQGAGAAGGTSAGAMAFLNAQMETGIDLVMRLTAFDKQLNNANLVITGEGSIDYQTLYGKVVKGVAQKAKQQGIPVLGFCGSLQVTPKEIAEIGLTAAFSVLQTPCTLQEAIEYTADGLENLAFNVLRLYLSMLPPAKADGY